MSEVRLTVGYDDFENGRRMEALIEALANGPESAEVESLIIGDWGNSYENGPDAFIRALIERKDAFPKLRKLFIGDMSYEECEVSWIIQTDLAPLAHAFPALTGLTIKGSNSLRLAGLSHPSLEELTIICGGLPKTVLEDIRDAGLPELRKLELYLGVEDYGFDGGIDDVLPFLEAERFPKLTYLGLKDSELQDEIAMAAANASIIDQLHTLDLSMGTLTDKGAAALLASEKIKKLSFLDLSYHYMSDDMVRRWEASGLQVDVSEQQEEDEDDWRYPSLTE